MPAGGKHGPVFAFSSHRFLVWAVADRGRRMRKSTMNRNTLLPLMAALAISSVLTRPAHADRLSSAISRERAKVNQYRSYLSGIRRSHDARSRKAGSISATYNSLKSQRARYLRAGQGALWQQRMNSLVRQHRSVTNDMNRLAAQYRSTQRLERGAVSEYNRLAGIQRQRAADAQRRAAWQAKQRRSAAEAQRREYLRQQQIRRDREVRRQAELRRRQQEQLRQQEMQRQSELRKRTKPRQTGGRWPDSSSKSASTRDQQLRRAIAEGRKMLAALIKTARKFAGPEPRIATTGTWLHIRMLREEIRRLEAELSRNRGKVPDKTHAKYEITDNLGKVRFITDMYVKVRSRRRTSRPASDGLNEFKVVFQYFYIDTEKPATGEKTRMEYEMRRIHPGESLASTLLSETHRDSPHNYRGGKYNLAAGKVFHSSRVHVKARR